MVLFVRFFLHKNLSNDTQPNLMNQFMSFTTRRRWWSRASRSSPLRYCSSSRRWMKTRRVNDSGRFSRPKINVSGFGFLLSFGWSQLWLRLLFPQDQKISFLCLCVCVCMFGLLEMKCVHLLVRTAGPTGCVSEDRTGGRSVVGRRRLAL